jgi:hypothetical protein
MLDAAQSSQRDSLLLINRGDACHYIVLEAGDKQNDNGS